MWRRRRCKVVGYMLPHCRQKRLLVAEYVQVRPPATVVAHAVCVGDPEERECLEALRVGSHYAS